MAVTLRQLAHAQALARLRSFRAAAESLHLSQPALTRSIRSLEKALGVPLFDRLSTGVEPTVFGDAFLGKAQLVLQNQDDMLREVQLLRGLEKGTLRVCAGPYPHDLHVPRVAATLAASYPGLSCRLALANWREVTAQVLARRADVGVADVGAATGHDLLRAEPVGRHRLYFFCRPQHRLSRLKSPTLRDLLGVPWVSTRVPLRLAAELRRQQVQAGAIDPETGDFLPAWEVEVVDAAKRIVATSDCVGAGLLTQFEGELASGALVALPFEADWLHTDYSFITLRNRTVSPAAAAFMALFRQFDAELVGRESALRRLLGRRPAARKRA